MDCHTGIIQYDSCTPAGQCPTTCGYQGGTVPNGQGGQTQCSATDACPVQCPANSTPNSDHICSCNQGYHQVSDREEGFACQADETPTNPDVCPNLDGVQTGVPDGLHLSASAECVAYAVPGEQVGGTGGQVQGASTQVLGTSTMAKTGAFDGNLYLAIMTLGGLLTFKSFGGIKKAFKKAN